MSRSQKEITNPCQKWFQWAGSTGELYYYDKEQKEKVKIKMPFTFLILDRLATIKGFDESAGTGIYSNEVKSTVTEILNVRCGTETIASGVYKDIKDKVVARGGGYAQSCYIAFKDGDKLIIGNIMMTGSSLSGGIHKPEDKEKKDIEVNGWLGFSKTHKNEIESKAISVTKDERVCTKGATRYYAPKFKIEDISDATNKEAEALDIELQEYFSEYLKRNKSVEVEEQPKVTKEQQFEKNSSDASFESDVAEAKRKHAEKAKADAEADHQEYLDMNENDSLPF